VKIGRLEAFRTNWPSSKSLALKEDIEVVDVFVEKQTAKVPGRPVFNEMLQSIEA
jgi:hypothetical protein